MNDSFKTRQELIRELVSLRKKTAELERSDAEHRKAEEDLRESEERYRTLIETTRDLVYITDSRGFLSYLNPTLEKTLGLAHGEFKGMSFVNITVPDHHENVRNIFRRAMKGESIPVYETALARKDGTRISVEFNVTTMLDKEGRPAGRYGIGRDVTERKRAEEALRDANRRLDDIIEFLPDATFVIDAGGKVIAWNKAMEQMTGAPKAEMIGKGNYEYALPFYGERRRTLIDVALVPDNAFEEERYGIAQRSADTVYGEVYAPKTYGGQGAYLYAAASRLRDASGTVVGAIESIRDITDRKRTEEKLRESEEQYRLFIENANDAIFIAQDGVIKIPNNKTMEVLGYTAEELARIPFTQHIHPEDRDMVLERHEMRLRGGSLQPVYSFRVLSRSGEEFWFGINAVRVDWGGRPATLNFMRDITEQKRLEAQLLQAQKMEAVGTLAGGLAHDFNNLLTGILGNASLAKMGMDPTDHNYERLQNIETSVESAVGLTRQLLAFSRGGRMDVRTSDINEILDKTAVIFSRTRKEISIHRNLHGDLWSAEVDRGQMEQVLLNLFVNAWQAMPGGGRLYLETANAVLTDMDVKHPYMKPGRYVKISVTDTGTGMDEKTKVRIFDPFFTTKEMGRGTGLGLAMVYGIIKGHNGYINVCSEPGLGTTFSVYLPASEKEISREAPLSQNVLRGTETILIVDDEEMNIDVSREILNLLGYTVLTASNGQDALALYAGKRGEIDLILLDMIMPGMSGGETYDRMKEINPGVRVILCSGYSIDGDAQTIMDRGCNGFIQKPVNLTDLSLKIREVLDKNK